MRQLLNDSRLYGLLLVIILALMFLFNLTLANAKTFRVHDEFCYSGDCFSVTRSNRVSIYNENVKDGRRDVTEYSSIKVNGGEIRNEKTGYIFDVKNDVITFETSYYKITYHQKQKMFLDIFDKTGRIKSSDIPKIKQAMKTVIDAYPYGESESGEIIPIDLNLNFPTSTAKLNVKAYVHGYAHYKGKTVPLVELKGSGSITKGERTADIKISGYGLRDIDTNITLRKVLDITITEKDGKVTKINKVVWNEIN